MKKLCELKNDVILISPSLLAADFNNLELEVKEIEQAGADMLHLDIMDGAFVPNISFGPVVISAIRKVSNLFFDVHLMIEHPLKYIESFVKAGANSITFHIESLDNPLEVIQKCKELGVEVGISLKPATNGEEILPYLKMIDLVLIMSVEPGFGGQSFMHSVMPKTQFIRNKITELNLPIQLEIDGGIDEETVKFAAQNGANLMVAGTSVFKHKLGKKAAMELLRRNWQNTPKTFCNS